MQRLGFGCPAIRAGSSGTPTGSVRPAAAVALVGGLLAALSWHVAPARAQQTGNPPRLALVIGNADYPLAPLPTSVNDAGLVAETLAQVGFDVTAMANVDGKVLARTLQAFEAKARLAPPDAVILVYLAGYGLQYDGDTFFVPLDARVTRGSDVPLAATRLSDLIKALEAVPAKAHVFIEDLAHESPFILKDGMPLAGGLAPTRAPSGSLYATNAAPGAVAPADPPPYGAYARALSEMIQAPGLDLSDLFRRVRLRTGEYTNGAAIPWDDATLDAPVSLSGRPAAAPAMSAAQPVAALSPNDAYSRVVALDTLAGYADFVRAFPTDALTPRVKMILAIRREASFWAAASGVNAAAAYWTYMRRYPRIAHYYDARRRLAALGAPLEPPPRFDITLFPDLPPPGAEEAALFDRAAITFVDPDWAPIPPPPAALLPPSRSAFTDELAPPPILPATILPIPLPPALPSGAASAVAGRISQPFVTALDEVLATTSTPAPGATTVTLEAGVKGLIARITMTADKEGNRTITQTGAKEAIQSRTTIIRDSRGATIVQTGPSGAVLTKAVTWTASNGARSTVIRNGGNQIVADIKRNDQGIVVSARAATIPAAMRQAPIILAPPANQAPPKAPPPTSDAPPQKAPPPKPGAGPVLPPAPPVAVLAKPAPNEALAPVPSVPTPPPPALAPKPPAPVPSGQGGLPPTRSEPATAAPPTRQPEPLKSPTPGAAANGETKPSPGPPNIVPLPIPRPEKSAASLKEASKAANRHGERKPERSH